MGEGQPRRKPRPSPPQPTPRQRLFTNEFKKGDWVYVTREEHGWWDGALVAEIIVITPMTCRVRSIDGGEYDIGHPRDITPGAQRPKPKK